MNVSLTVDETRLLCHMLMADKKLQNSFYTGGLIPVPEHCLSEKEGRVLMGKMLVLYNKLDYANDIVAGKG